MILCTQLRFSISCVHKIIRFQIFEFLLFLRGGVYHLRRSEASGVSEIWSGVFFLIFWGVLLNLPRAGLNFGCCIITALRHHSCHNMP